MCIYNYNETQTNRLQEDLKQYSAVYYTVPWKTTLNVNTSELLTRDESEENRCHYEACDLQRMYASHSKIDHSYNFIVTPMSLLFFGPVFDLLI